MAKKVLVIEGDSFRDQVIASLAQANDSAFEFEFAERLSAGLARLDQGNIDVVLLDLALPDVEDLVTLIKSQQRQAALPIIVLLGSGNQDMLVRTLQAGACDCLPKTGLDRQTLRRALQAAVGEWTEQIFIEPARSKDTNGNSTKRDTHWPLTIRGYERLSETEGNGGQYQAATDIGEGEMVLRESKDQGELERKNAEAALRESEARYRLLAENSTEVIMRCSLDGRCLYLSPSTQRILGYEPAEQLNRPFYQYVHHDDWQKVERVTQHLLTGATSYTVTYRFRHKDGHYLWLETEARLLRHSQTREPLELIAVTRDITKHRRTEAQLRQQAALLDNARDAILVTDLEDRVLLWWKGAERVYGWTASEAKGKTLRELFYPEGSPKFEQARGKALEHGEWSGETKQRTKEGREITVEGRWTLVRDDAGQPRSFLVINTDITDRKRIEAHLLRAQRMDSIGALASGIAHDLNNVLAPILMALRPLQQKFTDENSQRWLSLIQKSAERGKDLISQVLTFAKGTTGEQAPLQLSQLVKDITRILKETLPRNIELETTLGDDQSYVIGDKTQLHQMMMNLCLNARDAMPQGGKLRVELESLLLSEQDVPTQAGATPGRFIRVTVTDTGIGIPQDLIDRIFDPFFTTKEHGKGTGLGLSISMGIVRSHGGFVDVSSEVNKGTQFRVYLPASDALAEAEDEEVTDTLVPGHGELILVVDDEEGIRDVVEATLEASGYRVLKAEDGEVALRLYEQHKDDIRVVLTDLMMPKKDGVTAIREMRALNPQVKVIVTTGVKLSGQYTEAAKVGFGVFLAKPYTADELLAALDQVLRKES